MAFEHGCVLTVEKLTANEGLYKCQATYGGNQKFISDQGLPLIIVSKFHAHILVFLLGVLW